MELQVLLAALAIGWPWMHGQARQQCTLLSAVVLYKFPMHDEPTHAARAWGAVTSASCSFWHLQNAAP